MDKNNENIKKDNKKAIPKFLLILLVSAIIGGFCGYYSVALGESNMRDAISNYLYEFLRIITPYISIISFVVFVLPAYIIYRKALKLAGVWDGESEEIPESIDKSLTRTMLLISIAMIVGFFGISCMLIVNCGLRGSLLAFFSFIVVELLISVIQQKTVDLTRRMNPEKQGSVYDTKFEKKWYESCDEAEKRQIGEAAYYSFRITSKSCIILWCVALFAHIVFDTGIFPVILVLVLAGISQISFITKAMKLGTGK